MKTMLIVLWFETHISTSVNSAETLPPIYTSYRRDWADDWGGVIIITKKNLTVEQMEIKK